MQTPAEPSSDWNGSHRVPLPKADSELAEQWLSQAPDQLLAKEANRRGWEIVNDKEQRRRAGPDLAVTQPYVPLQAPTSDVKPAMEIGTRFMIWVDAVGGYLACLDSQIDIGQASSNNLVHVPIIADLSRRHARIRRDGESYVLEPMSLVKVNGAPCMETKLLSDNDVLEFGAVRMRFRQSHALSATARLDLESRHKTQPSADAILLFAESCVLGPGQDNHVVCRNWESDVVLYRQGERLFVRSTTPFELDGRPCESRAELDRGSHVCGEDFSLSLEPL